MKAGLIAFAVWAAASVAAAGPISARDAVVRPAPAGLPTTAAYLTLVNSGAKPVRLTGVSCACAAEVMAHRSEADHGVMRMRPAGAVTVPAHGSVSFAPGGLHLMLMGLKRPIREGELTPMRLSFDGAPTMTVKFVTRR
jgi:hypothetical protein